MNFNSVVKQIFGKLKIVGGTDGTIIGNDGDSLKVSATMVAEPPSGLLDSGNSSTTPLGANATFTGDAIEIKDYSAINVAAFSDVSSATDGLKMQFSPDGINWDHQHSFSVIGNIGVSYAQSAELRYFRIVYVNDSSPQTLFRLTTILKPSNVSPSRYTVGQQLQSGQMADVTKSIIWGLSSSGGGSYVATKVTPSGSLTTAIGDITDIVGQETMADSIPVTIASDQSPVPASQSGVWNITNVTGTVSLPTGAATESKQDTANTSLSSIDTKVATAAKQDTGNASLASIDGKVATEAKQDSQITELQAIKGHVDGVETKLDTLISQTDGIESSLTSIDSKVSTAEKQDTGNASLASIDTKVATAAKQDSQISELQEIKGHVDGIETKLDSLISQTDNIETSLSSIDGKVSTAAKQDTGNSSLASIDGKVATEAKQDSQITELQAIKGHVDQVETKLDTLISQTDEVESSLSSIDTKVATAAKQDTGNASLSSIDSKTPTLGQKTSTGSQPVVIASDQSAVPASQSGIWNITNLSGTISLPTGAATSAAQDTGNSSLASIDTKVSTAAKQDTGNASLASIDGKVATEAKQDSQITELQAIKGHVDLVETKLDTLISQTDGVESSLSSIDTKVSTAAKQDTGNASLASIDTKVATQAKQDSQITELQAIKGHVDQVETKLDTLITQTDGIESSLTSIDGKVSTAAKQDTGNASLASIDGKLNSLGQKASAGSVPVVIANDQSPVAVSQSGTWNINQLSTIVNPLPTGTNNLGNVFLNGALGTKIGQVSDTLKVSIGSGTVGPAAVMGASQSPTVSDLSLVVQISPNQDPIPTTVVPTDAISGNAQGKTPATGNGVFTAIRQTTYTAQTTAAQRSIVSSSANDSATGTGAQQVKIYFLDATASGPSPSEPFFTETVTLNGTTAVNTIATNICFIEKIEVVAVGSGGSNAGTITLFTGTGGTGTAIGSIATGSLVTGQGDNMTLWAHHYVPANFLSDVYAITGGCAAAAGGGNYVQQLRKRNPTLATSPDLLLGDVITVSQGNAFLRTFGSSLLVMGPSIITLYGTPGTNNTVIYGSFDFADRPS